MNPLSVEYMSDAQREACDLSLSNKYTPSTISKARFTPLDWFCYVTDSDHQFRTWSDQIYKIKQKCWDWYYSCYFWLLEARKPEYTCMAASNPKEKNTTYTSEEIHCHRHQDSEVQYPQSYRASTSPLLAIRNRGSTFRFQHILYTSTSPATCLKQYLMRSFIISCKNMSTWN
jgi:hypothetical protein